VADNPWNITLAGEQLLSDRDFLIQIIHDHPDCLRHLPAEMKSDAALSELAEKRKAELSDIRQPENPKPRSKDDDLPF
jgi:hypothetical protein